MEMTNKILNILQAHNINIRINILCDFMFLLTEENVLLKNIFYVFFTTFSRTPSLIYSSKEMSVTDHNAFGFY